MTPRHAIGIDVGGTKIEASVISSHGDVLRTIREPTIKNEKQLFDQFHHIINELKGDEALSGIGFSIPGSVEPQTGILRNAPNSPQINNTAIFNRLKTSLAFPSIFENDANCLALSESLFGAAKGCKNVVGIIMGTGFGCGALVEGRLLHGWRGLAPEIGHTILDVNGRQCLCGNRGCVEAYLSGPSILKRYQEAGGDPSLTETRQIFERHGDAVAKKILGETQYLYARVMAEITSIYDPEIIVLGGGLSLQPFYYQCGELVAQNVFGSDQAPQIKKAALGDASGKLGAAAFFF